MAFRAPITRMARLFVRSAFGECDALLSEIETECLNPLPGFFCSASAFSDRFSDLVPRGTGLEAYARLVGTEQKAHRNERDAAVGGRTLSGGVRSSIRTPPPFGIMLYPPHHAVNLVETARGMNGQPAGIVYQECATPLTSGTCMG